MWTLPSPDIAEAINQLGIAFTRADGNTDYDLNAGERLAVGAAYVRYDQELGHPHPDLEQPAGLTEALRVAVHSAYSQVQKKRRLAALRSSLMLAAGRCPYCAISAVSDLDHFLPKGAYKTFAIYPRNLVPSCGPCNGKKHAHAGDNLEERFIHAYLEAVPAGQFFTATAAMENGAVKITFDVDDAVVGDPVMSARLRHHIERLELNDRYEGEINIILSPFAGHLADLGASPESAEVVSAYLQKSAQSERRKLGDNHWIPLTFDSVSNCADFCEGGFRTALGLVPPPPPAA